MVFAINHKTRTAFLAGLLSIFCTLSALPALAQYEQSLEELSSDLNIQESNAELDSYLLQAYSGDKEAQFKLGALYSSGESGVIQDDTQAIYWYKKAAEQGHDSAQYNLGHKYLEGKGVEKDITKAIAWWKKAAEQQHELAQFNLGRAYYLGIGTQKDEKKSRHWFTQAANNGEVRSIAIIKKMNWDAPPTETAMVETAMSDKTTASKKTATLSDKTDMADTTLRSDVSENDPTLDQIREASDKKDGTDSGTNIAIYTNPVIKPLLITIAKSEQDINVLTEQGKWLKINSKIGLPVWTHQDFIKINGKVGTITGSNVNTRSTPMITRGSIVGRLNKKEQVRVLGRKGEWVRVLSPSRFKGWIKKYEHRHLLDAPAEDITETVQQEKPDYSIINGYHDKISDVPYPSEEQKKQSDNKWQIK